MKRKSRDPFWLTVLLNSISFAALAAWCVFVATGAAVSSWPYWAGAAWCAFLIACDLRHHEVEDGDKPGLFVGGIIVAIGWPAWFAWEFLKLAVAILPTTPAPDSEATP